MNTGNSFAFALKFIRKARGISQEAFSDVSSRTYMSTLERGLKSPTLNKIESLCEVLEVHPVTLLLIAYVKKGDNGKNIDELLQHVQRELSELTTVNDDAPEQKQ